jgi:hypothetical protein
MLCHVTCAAVIKSSDAKSAHQNRMDLVFVSTEIIETDQEWGIGMQ